ncbi:MAG TPA: hypothetical protein VI072_26170 [Polyangiaceae bacterium]
MPPDASSRSSTYLPKTCGNIALAYRSAVRLLPLLFVGCGSESARVLHIHAHAPAGCRVPAEANLQLRALGDFDVSNRTVEIVGASARERELPLPSATRAVAVRAAGSSAGFHGLGERNEDRVDVLLWPDDADCALYTAAGQGAYPAPLGRQALGVSASQQALLVAGGVGDSSASALSVNLQTGEATRIDGAGGLLERHEYATISEFGDGLLVAGGYDVVERRNASAEVFEAKLGRFASTVIGLINARRRHAAVVRESGETLLIGGLNGSGRPLGSLEVVSPATRLASAVVPLLHHARVEPSTARLDDGRVLVASGMSDEGDPGTLTSVPGALEWISADAKSIVSSEDTVPSEDTPPPRFNRALIGMPGGAALAVGGCEDRAALPGEACSARCGVLPEELANSLAGRARGCPPARFDVWWIREDKRATQLPDLPPGIDASRPALVFASDASPWLLAGGAVLRFEPWTGRFIPADLPERVALPEDIPAPVAIDAGAFVWLSEAIGAPSGLPEVALRGFRHGTRGRFESDTPLVFASALHMTPNQAPVLADGSAGDVHYDGALHLRGSEARAFVTDTLYRDVEVVIDLARDSTPPTLLLDDSRFDWTPLTRSQPQTLIARRRGDAVDVTDAGGTSRQRQSLAQRVRLGLQGPEDGASVVTRLEIRRSL